MRKAFVIPALLFAVSLPLWTQSSSQSASAAQSSKAAKPTVHHTATGNPTAIIETSVGNLTCTLFPDKAPIGVDNFIGLATGTKDWKTVKGVTKHGVPLYDGTIFHRVIPEFMIQGGDPAGNGTGDPGYTFKNEVSSDLLFDRPGRLAYANSGPDTNGSQFFIMEEALAGQHAAMLNGRYTIFGQCDAASVALVKQIARMATDPSTDHRPFRPVKIVHIKIVRSETAAPVAKTATPSKKPAASTSKPPSSPN